MTATSAVNGSWVPIGNAAIPMAGERPLVASGKGSRGQFITVSPSTGNAALNDGTVPNQISGGFAYPAVESGSSTVAGSAHIDLWQGFSGGIPASTTANDGFTAADYGVEFWIKDENTPGKLSNSGASNRSMGGLVFGVDANGNPILWPGPVAQLLARATHLTTSKVGAWYQIATAAGTDTAEVNMVCEKVHGVITAIEIEGIAIAADNTDYVTLTITKRDKTGGTPVVVGTYDSRVANQGATTSFVPLAFALSAVAGALNRLETDTLTITAAHGGAGKGLTGNIRVIQKVI